MKIKLGSDRRITIPKSIFDMVDFKPGDEINIDVCGKNIMIGKGVELDPVKEHIKTVNLNVEENKPKEVKQVNVKHITKPRKKTTNNKDIKVVNRIKIVSNLEEGSKFSNKFYSDCGLVIRTKNRYLRDFCNACKGYLLEEHGDNPNCPYSKNHKIKDKDSVTIKQTKTINESVTPDINRNALNQTSKAKTIINELIKNVSKLESKLNQDLERLQPVHTKPMINNTVNNEFIGTADSIITPVKYDDFVKCTCCSELHNKGFLIDGIFKCKRCTIDDFKNYYNNRNGGKD